MTRPTPGIILLVTLLCVLISAADAADTLTITARQTVVRAGPDSKWRILATVPQGTTLALLERRQGWYKVLLDDGQEGWVAQSAAQVQDGRGITVVPAGGAAGPGRSALVIGNAAYSEDIGSLKNPGNDATDMAATLRQLDFAVTLVRDANHQRMAEAVEAFSLPFRPGSVGVFYYAGHGAQVVVRTIHSPGSAHQHGGSGAVPGGRGRRGAGTHGRRRPGQVAQRHDPRRLPQRPLHAWLALTTVRLGTVNRRTRQNSCPDIERVSGNRSSEKVGHTTGHLPSRARSCRGRG